MERYPDSWVFIQQTKGDTSNIEEGVVRFVAKDDGINFDIDAREILQDADD